MGSPVAPPPPSPAADPGEATRGRRLHYGEFYGLRPLPPDDGRPLVVVHGNCQAESLRVLLAGSLRSVRVPPVHELERDDLPHLRRTLAHACVLLSQPVRPDYRDLPLGTAQVTAALPSGAQTVLFPVMRYAGLFPFQAIVRSPVGDPPVVPYHDLRTLVQSVTGTAPARAASASAYRAVAEQSLEELRSRERRHGLVPVSDLLPRAGADAAHTVNHPGNTVLRGLAERVLERLGRTAAVPDPGRTLLDAVHAPLAADVLEALGIDAEPREHWVLAGRTVPDEVVRDRQLQWYGAHPEVAAAGLERHAATLRLLALA